MHPCINLYFSIFDSIKTRSRLPDPASLNISKSLLSYYTRKLVKDDIIENIGYGTWQIKKDNIYIAKYISQLKEVQKCTHDTRPFLTSFNVRGHGFIVTLSIPKIPNWSKREQYLYKKGINYINIPQGQRITINNNKVWLTAKSIVIYLNKDKSYYQRSAKEAKQAFLYDLYKLFKNLENLLNTSLKRNKAYRFNINRQHYGKVHDNLAEAYNKDSKRLEVRNNKGLWLLTDRSLKADELETVHKDTAVKDMDNIMIPFLNDIKGYTETTGEVPKLSRITQLINDVVKNQAYHEANIKSHIAAIKELARSTKRMTELLAKK